MKALVVMLVLAWTAGLAGADPHAAPRRRGAHGAASCLTCHPTFKPSPTACADCHDKQRPHEAMGACPTCHTTSTWRTTTFDHAAPSAGFALTGKHQRVACTACHPTKVDWNAPVRGCLDCHADPHGTQFKGNVCTECHTTSGFVPSLIDVDKHDLFAFPLKGAHRQATCASCHRGGVFIGVSQTCASCHADRHDGRFGAQCQECHTVSTWREVRNFDHTITGFTLEAKHAGVACAGCHGTDGKALAKVKAPTDCRTCHATPHDRHFPATCGSCHSTQGWAKVPRYDHDATAFPLELRHKTLGCRSCHDAKRKPPVTSACRSCHGDPHRGSTGYECDDCHRADRWRVIRFDHDVTAYPLVGRHRVAACAGCHRNPAWTGVRTDCIACHAFDRPRTGSHPPEPECEDCHNQWRWRTLN